MSEDNDTNCGMGMVYDTPEEKQIEYLKKKIKQLKSDLDAAVEKGIREGFREARTLAFIDGKTQSWEKWIDVDQYLRSKGGGKG